MSPSALALPPHVKVILITGAGGFVGRELTQLILDSFSDVSLITTDIQAPPTFGITDVNRLRPIAADLSDAKQIEELLAGQRVQAVFALQ